MGRGWALVRQSWGVLRANRTLIAFPVIAAVAQLLAAAILFGPGIAIAISSDSSVPAIVAAVIAAYVLTNISVFFNVALAACAQRAMQGEQVSVGEGLAAARSRLGPILAWGTVSATVGVLIRDAQERLGLLGDLAVGLLGVAWSIATFFVIPVLALEDVGVKGALKRSGQLVKQRWGEQVTGTVSIGGILLLVAVLPVVLLIGGGLAATSVSPVLGGALIALGVVALMIAMLLGAALRQVFGVALYRFAMDGQAIGPFSQPELEGAFAPKRGRLR